MRVDFELAAFASTKPHRDDEGLAGVSGYDIIPKRGTVDLDVLQHEEIEWSSGDRYDAISDRASQPVLSVVTI